MQPFAGGDIPLSQRTSEGVARVLRNEIFSGRMQPGEPLRERCLAEQLDVSRTPVREALFTLHSEGLVELSPNRGATVRTITSHEIVQIYSVRTLLESYAAGEAATCRTRADLEALADAQAKLERLSANGSAYEQALADLAFHQIISDAAGSRLLRTIMGQVLAFTVSFRSHYVYSPERSQSAIAQHREILEALRDEDQQRSERLMREHVECSKQFALAHFDECDQSVVP